MIIADAILIRPGPHDTRIIPIQAYYAILAQARLVERIILQITHLLFCLIQDIDASMIRRYPYIPVHILFHVTNHGGGKSHGGRGRIMFPYAGFRIQTKQSVAMSWIQEKP